MIEKPFASDTLCPSGFVTTTFHPPVVAVGGRVNWQVICVEETAKTPVAGMSAEPVRCSFTVAPGWKPVPSSPVTTTVDPWTPVAGVIETIVGAGTVEKP